MLVDEGRFATVVLLRYGASFGVVMRSDNSGPCALMLFSVFVIVATPIAESVSVILCYKHNT
jgi:hypothetical protein